MVQLQKLMGIINKTVTIAIQLMSLIEHKLFLQDHRWIVESKTIGTGKDHHH